MRKFQLILNLCLIIVLGINLQACSSIQQMIQGTPTFTSTSTLTPSPTVTLTSTPTLTPTRTPKPTTTPNLVATQQYEDFIAVVQQVYDAGHISTLDGTYVKLDDYSDELAMSYGYSWAPTGVNAQNFIVRADFDWEVANQKNYSGCGYVFWQAGLYYFVALDGLNGVLLQYTKYDGSYPAPLIKKMDMPDMGSNPYHAQFTLVVTDTAAYTYVNGNFLTEHRLQSDWPIESGQLSSLILTGSDKDYGTRCKITNAELWVMEP